MNIPITIVRSERPLDVVTWIRSRGRPCAIVPPDGARDPVMTVAVLGRRDDVRAELGADLRYGAILEGGE